MKSVFIRKSLPVRIKPGMRKRLHIVLMASILAATSLSRTPQLRAADGGDGFSETIAPTKIVPTKITVSDEHGRTVYVNDSVAASPSRHTRDSEPPRRTLKYWSSKENRWKPVPPPNGAVMRAAQSAASEVDEYLGHDPGQSDSAKMAAANFRGPLATSADINSAIEKMPKKMLGDRPSAAAIGAPRIAGR